MSHSEQKPNVKSWVGFRNEDKLTYLNLRAYQGTVAWYDLDRGYDAGFDCGRQYELERSRKLIASCLEILNRNSVYINDMIEFKELVKRYEAGNE